MVELNINVKELVGLFRLGSLDQKALKKHLETFSKEDLLGYIVESAPEIDVGGSSVDPDDPYLG